MHTLVLSLHVVLALMLIGLVLLQQGKGADVGAIMGSSGSNSLFGAGGASSVLLKLTTSVAVLFMLTSVMLVRLSSSGPLTGGQPVDPLRGSVLEGAAAPIQQKEAEKPSPIEAPAAPAPVVPPQTGDSGGTSK